MKRFKVEQYNGTTIIVTLNQAPYERANILHKTGWQDKKDLTITDITPTFDEGEE